MWDIARLTPLELKVLQLGHLVRKEQQEQRQQDATSTGGQTPSQRERSKAHYREHFYGDS